MPELGKLGRVDPRSFWSNEETEFIAWLRQSIGELSEQLSLDIALPDSDVSDGQPRHHMVGWNSSTDRAVIIAGQLGRTDQIHLGQLLTSAAAVQAGFVIWIAAKFRDEHRQALEWLNEISGAWPYLLGVELELFQVDDSPLAPYFKLVTRPGEWRTDLTTPAVSLRNGQQFRESLSELLSKLKAEPVKDLVS